MFFILLIQIDHLKPHSSTDGCISNPEGMCNLARDASHKLTVFMTSLDSAQNKVHLGSSRYPHLPAFSKPSVCSMVRVRGMAAAGRLATFIFFSILTGLRLVPTRHGPTEDR